MQNSFEEDRIDRLRGETSYSMKSKQSPPRNQSNTFLRKSSTDHYNNCELPKKSVGVAFVDGHRGGKYRDNSPESQRSWSYQGRSNS